MKKCVWILVLVIVVCVSLTGCKKETIHHPEGESVPAGIKIEMDENNQSSLSMGKYEGLKVSAAVLPDITDADVENYVMSVVESALVVNENTSRAVEAGDTVNVAYTGYLDGVEIPDSSIDDYNILIGSGIFFNGAESELIGAMAGETVDIFVTFPAGYPKAELIGKSAVYKVTVNYIHEEGQGELTDDFVASISECKSVGEFYQMIRQELEASRENERILVKENAVWEAVLEQVEDVQYDEKALSALMEEYKAYDRAAAEDFEMSLEAYVSTYQGVSIEEYNMRIQEMAQSVLLDDMVVEYIAKDQGIDGNNPTEEEINAVWAKQGYESADAYVQRRSDEDMQMDIMKIRVMEYLMSVSEIVEE